MSAQQNNTQRNTNQQEKTNSKLKHEGMEIDTVLETCPPSIYAKT